LNTIKQFVVEKDALNCSKVTLKTFILLQTISISNKLCFSQSPY